MPWSQLYENSKTSFANGVFFQLSARLAHSTGNTNYSDWFSKIFDWSSSSGIIDADWNLYEPTNQRNCSDILTGQASSYVAVYIGGVANMYNITKGSAQTKWKAALEGLLNQTINIFFPGSIITQFAEYVQDRSRELDNEGLIARNLVNTIKLAPYTTQAIMPNLVATAIAAVKNCTLAAEQTRLLELLGLAASRVD